VDGATVDSGMLGNANLTALQQKLASVSTSYKYDVVMETDVYRYEWLFHLDLVEPLLSRDYKAMERQLAAAWMYNDATSRMQQFFILLCYTAVVHLSVRPFNFNVLIVLDNTSLS
jgi:hypothetical protein